MAIRQMREGHPLGSEQGLGVDVGAQAGTGALWQGETQSVERQDLTGGMMDSKPLKPLPHGVIDYAMAGMMLAAPWLLGFKRNKTATMYSVGTGAAVLGLSLMTKYPLGAVKMIPFPTHGIIETTSAAMTVASPWLLGFSRNRAAKWSHVISGLATLAVVALTDYKAAEQPGGADAPQLQDVVPQAVSDMMTGDEQCATGGARTMTAGAGGGE